MKHPSQPRRHNQPQPAQPCTEQVERWWAEARAGQLTWSELAERLWSLDHPAIGSHCPDVDRARRSGFGEVIYASGKSPEAIVQIAQRLLDSGEEEILVTRLDPAAVEPLRAAFSGVRFDPVGRTARLARREIATVRRFTASPLVASRSEPVALDGTSNDSSDLPSPALGEHQQSDLVLPPVAVVTGGSTDQPVAQEAVETLRWMGIEPSMIGDVGVAGPYRIIAHLPLLRQCAAVVVIAGMEGALASVVGGQVPGPVIAVPTSVGYGANLQGMTTLLSMLSSCAASVTTVNVDAGFKGGYIAGLIAHQVARGAART